MERDYNISINTYLINLRKNANLSIKQLSKKIKISSLTIFNLERGYRKLNNKLKLKYINYFNLDNNVFDTLNEIADSIVVEENSIKFLFNKKLTLFISLLVGIISSIICAISYNVRQNRFQNPRNYLHSEYYNLYDLAKEEKTKDCDHYQIMNLLTADIFLIRTDYNYYNDHYNYTIGNITVSNNIYFATSESKSLIFGINSYITNSETGDNITYKLNYRGGINSRLKGDIEILTSSDDGLKTYSKNLYYSSKNGLYISKDKVDNYELVDNLYDTYKDIFIESWDQYFLNNTKYNTIDYLNLILPKTISFSKSTVRLFYTYLISSFIAIISYFTFIMSILATLSDKIKYKENEYNEVVVRDRQSIVKNKYISPFIKEGYIKIICMTLLTISNFALLFYYSRYLGRVDYNIPIESDILKRIINITRIGSLGLVIVTCKTYTRDIYAYRKTSIFLLAGLLFYAFEYFFLMRMFESNILLSLFTQYIPSNFFLAIFLLLLQALFLFKTPKHIDSKLKLIVYRLLSLIPVLLFILSYTLKMLDVKAIVVLPLYIELLIPQKLVGVELFGVIFLYSMYFFELIIKKKHSASYLKQFKHTNTYYWIENIIICVLLILLTLAEYIPALSQNLSHIGVGKLKYTYLLLILFAFYHPRIEKPNSMQNLLYSCSFLISIVIPYVLLGYQILYYIMI